MGRFKLCADLRTPTRKSDGCFLTLPQVPAEDVDDTAQTKDCEGNCRQDRPEEMSPRGWIPVHYRGSELFDPLFFFNVPIESGLKCGLHSVLVVLFEPHEPERLMTP